VDLLGRWSERPEYARAELAQNVESVRPGQRPDPLAGEQLQRCVHVSFEVEVTGDVCAGETEITRGCCDIVESSGVFDDETVGRVRRTGRTAVVRLESNRASCSYH
jgi:hypothetical protein